VTSSIAAGLAWAFAVAQAQATVPVLRYTPPPNAMRAVIEPAEDYSFSDFNASVQVYPFRPFTGNMQQIFQTTLLRDWISPMHKEENVGAAPSFQRVNVPGADLAISANFVEVIVGLPKPHNRMVIVVGDRAAIVDASAGTAQSWQRAIPFLNAMAGTLRVEAARAPAALTPEAGRAVAGLYQGMKPKYNATMMNVTGFASTTPALHFYLFSADGRVYRAYDAINLPGGNIALFDFGGAERRDPDNSGRYTVDEGKLHLQMGSDGMEAIVAPVPDREGLVTINATLYKRQ